MIRGADRGDGGDGDLQGSDDAVTCVSSPLRRAGRRRLRGLEGERKKFADGVQLALAAEALEEHGGVAGELEER